MGRLGIDPKTIMSGPPQAGVVEINSISAQFEPPEPRRILPIATEPDPSSATTPHQLTRSSETAGLHLVHQQVEADSLTAAQDAPAWSADRGCDPVARLSRLPAATDHVR